VEHGPPIIPVEVAIVVNVVLVVRPAYGGRRRGGAARASDSLIVKVDVEGKKAGVGWALQFLDLLADQLIRAQVPEPDPGQCDLLDTRLRDVYSDYVHTGILSQAEAIRRAFDLYRTEERQQLSTAFPELEAELACKQDEQ
jgi:hypothetical protein